MQVAKAGGEAHPQSLQPRCCCKGALQNISAGKSGGPSSSAKVTPCGGRPEQFWEDKCARGGQGIGNKPQLFTVMGAVMKGNHLFGVAGIQLERLEGLVLSKTSGMLLLCLGELKKSL